MKARFSSIRYVLTTTATANSTSNTRNRHLLGAVCVAALLATMWVNITKMAEWLSSKDSAKLEKKSRLNHFKSWYQWETSRSIKKIWTIWSITSCNQRIKPNPKIKTRKKTRRKRAKVVGSERKQLKSEEWRRQSAKCSKSKRNPKQKQCKKPNNLRNSLRSGLKICLMNNLRAACATFRCDLTSDATRR